MDDSWGMKTESGGANGNERDQLQYKSEKVLMILLRTCVTPVLDLKNGDISPTLNEIDERHYIQKESTR